MDPRAIAAMQELTRRVRAQIPRSFIEFAARTGVKLTAGQIEYARVAFDGERPSDTELARKIWGDVGDLPPNIRDVVSAVFGARGGKSLLAGLRILHIGLTTPLHTLARDEEAVCLIVAPDLATARITLRFAHGAALALGLTLDADSADGFTVKRERPVRIEVRAASAGGMTGRGRTMPCAVLDECAFFRDRATGKVNDEDIFAGISPRIMAGGQLIVNSTPWAQTGLLYGLWERNWGRPKDALVAYAPTSLMRAEHPDILRQVERERIRDPQNARREFDAEFTAVGGAAFFDPRAIADAIVGELPLVEGSTRAMGGDFAFRRNASAFVGVQLHDQWIDVVSVDELVPEGGPLKPSDVCAAGAAAAKAIGADEIVADGHYRESITENLFSHDVGFVIGPEGATGKAERYQLVRALLHEGRIRLPRHEKLIRQLREVVSKSLAGGGLSIDSPVWKTGEHGDIADAFVFAVWRAHRIGWVEKDVEPEYGTPEYWKREQEAMFEKKLAKIERQQSAYWWEEPE